MDSIIAKWKEIVNWQRANLPDPLSDFGDPADKSQIKKIESLLGEKVPEDFRKLYAFSDGEKNREFGLLFGHELADTNQIINSLEFSRTLIKPEHPEVTNPEQSDKLVKKIIEFYTSRILLPFWHRIEFTCMVVIADHLESFFDFILNEIKRNGAAELKNGTHLHDVIKTIIKNR